MACFKLKTSALQERAQVNAPKFCLTLHIWILELFGASDWWPDVTPTCHFRSPYVRLAHDEALVCSSELTESVRSAALYSDVAHAS